MSRRRISALLGLVLVLAACGSGGDESQLEGVASLGDGTATGSDGGAVADRASFEDGLLEFTTCMRDNGVDMPDLQVDASGAPRIPTDGLGAIDTSSPEFVAAFSECVGILADSSPVDITTDPELNAAVQDQLQAFAECMRDNGMSDFPDPAPGFNGRNSPFPLNEIDTQDPNLQPALDECQSLIAFPTIGG
jgi:hypothetical protein